MTDEKRTVIIAHMDSGKSTFTAAITKYFGDVDGQVEARPSYASTDAEPTSIVNRIRRLGEGKIITPDHRRSICSKAADTLTTLSAENAKLKEELAARDARMGELEADKQSMFHSLHEIYFYEGGAESAIEDEYVLQRLSDIVDKFKEPFDLEDAASSFLGRPVILSQSQGCSEDRIKRCVSGLVAGDGSCMYCDADQGVACRTALSESEGA